MIWSIAWRNVWRNKLRSLIIMIAVAVGLSGGIIYYAFAKGLMEQRIESAISNEISNIQIHNPKYLLNEEIKFTIRDYENITSEINKIEGVKAVSNRIKVMGMASTAETGTGIMLNGIDPAIEKQVTKISEQLTEGKYIEEKGRIPIVIGQKLAKKLNIKLRSKIVITAANADGVITYGAFKVVGIYDTENDMFDEVNAFVRKKDLARMLGINLHSINEIAIALDKHEQTNQVFEMLNEKFSDKISQKEILIRPWNEIVPSLNAMIEMMDFFSYIFMIIILIALAFGIVNTMLMVVMERIKELGILKAVGMNNKKLFQMIMLETIFLSIIGGIFGLLFSYMFIQYFGYYGLNLAAFQEGYNSMGFSSIVYLQAEISFYIFTTILVIITAIVASIYPARKALKLNPAVAIREL
jgi:ABC-type lipoprotein release transport system permease subunit